MVKKPPAMQETWVQSLGREDSLEKGMATHSVFLPGESHGQRSLAVCMQDMGSHTTKRLTPPHTLAVNFTCTLTVNFPFKS